MAGRTQKAKGRVKESAGALTGDKGMKDRGRLDQASGTAKQKTQKAKDKVAGAAKKAKGKLD